MEDSLVAAEAGGGWDHCSVFQKMKRVLEADVGQDFTIQRCEEPAMVPVDCELPTTMPPLPQDSIAPKL